MDAFFADAHLPQLAKLFERIGRKKDLLTLSRHLGERGIRFKHTDPRRLRRIQKEAQRLGYYATSDLGLAADGSGHHHVVIWAPEVEGTISDGDRIAHDEAMLGHSVDSPCRPPRR